MSYTDLVPRPADANMNTDLHALRPATVIGHLGSPRATYSQDCRPVTNPAWKRRIISYHFTHFSVEGLDIAVHSLVRVMAAVYAKDKALYAWTGIVARIAIAKSGPKEQ